MALFGRSRSKQASSGPLWTPTVHLETARPVVFALANAPASDEQKVRVALHRFTQLADAVPLERAMNLMQHEPDVISRPWKWLLAVIQHAGRAGEDHLAAAALYWACYWTSSLVPRNNVGSFMELGLDPIPTPLKTDIAAAGVDSTRRLAETFVVVGDSSGQITAGPLAATAHQLLGL